MDINTIIISAIEEEKQLKIKEYDKIINAIKNETNIAVLYYALTKAYNNSNKQGEIQIKFLKKNFKNPFFQNAKVSNSANYITFENDLFKINFNKGYGKSIDVLYKNENDLLLPYIYIDYDDNISDICTALNDYLNNKSFRKLKDIIILRYGKEPQGILNKLSKYREGYLKYDENYLKKMQQKKYENGIRRKRHEESLEKRNKTIKEIENFIESLTDLRPFREEGFIIRTNIYKDGQRYILNNDF